MNTRVTGLLFLMCLQPCALAADEPGARDSQHVKMVSVLRGLANRATVENRYYGRGFVDQMKKAEARLVPRLTPLKKLEFDFQVGLYELQLGNELQAIERMETGYREAASLLEKNKISSASYFDVAFRTGVAHLRNGETQNCCVRHHADSCLFPIRGGGIHTKQTGSRNAIRYFLEVLRGVEKGSVAYYRALWLLNIAYMTVDEHPAKVPPEFLISPQAFESDEAFPRFTNVAKRLGLDEFSMSGSVVADDFDRDGWIDLLVGSWDLREQLKFYKNDRGKRFIDQTEASGLMGLPGGLNMVQADFNNDGFVDVLVLRGAWLFAQGRHPNSLLQNNGDGTFTDVTFSAGLAEQNYPTQTASWADYDLDGDLDLYIGNEVLGNVASKNQLFRNNGDGTFTDVAEQAGVANERFSKSVIWGDYDHDRFPDLFVSNMYGKNRLYRNQGDGTFVDVASKLGVESLDASFPSFFWDYNNDGHLDLYVAAFDERVESLAKRYVGDAVDHGFSHLYEGDGQGGFREVAAERGLDEPVLAMGLNFGDLDNDGYLDFYLGTGAPQYRDVLPNKMYRSKQGRQFADVSVNGGFSNLQKGHAVAFFDWDRDGDLDIFQQMGGAFAGDKYTDSFYENPGFSNNWISIDVVGKESNRSAIGTRIRIVIKGNAGATRQIFRHVNSGGSFGASPLRQTIGLGKAKRVETLELYWPKTDRTQVLHNIAAGQVLRIVEGESR